VELFLAIYKILGELQTSRAIYKILGELQTSWVSQLINFICNSSFLVSLHVVENTSAILLWLSKMLQEKIWIF